MRATQLLLATKKEDPADAEIVSHKLMLRAGMIRKLASGLYTWLPMGLRVFRKVEHIVREEMNKSGAQEILMPVVQPSELWQESQRWEQYGKELLRINDRHNREFCLGPTHEEVVTDLVRNEIHSYKQLPVNFYQIQTKFRDEIRPRFGLMRTREFCMKDAYSFHIDQQSLQTTYDVMHSTYCTIFEKLKLDFRPVIADNGSIGGSGSHEFHVLADSGEDLIAFSDSSSYAANLEKAEALNPAPIPAPSDTDKTPPQLLSLESVNTGEHKTIEAVSQFLGLDTKQTVKTLIVKGNNIPMVALVLRGDHQLNAIKASNHPLVASPLEFADESDILKTVGCAVGTIGPVEIGLPTIIDHEAAALSSFCCGANKDQTHFINCHWHRDSELEQIADLRNVEEGDPSPDGQGKLVLKRGIEVGHIFQLGTKYSETMNATVLDENGKQKLLTMGCYGIGVSRIVAAAIEQNHDEHGIIWPAPLAPFSIALVPLNHHKSDLVREAAEALYAELLELGIDVLFDDRKERPGVKFAELELIGIPHRVVIGERSLKEGEVEYKARAGGEAETIPLQGAAAAIASKLANAH